MKARLSEYLAAAKAGEEVLVTDRGRPVARLVPLRGLEAADARLADLVRSGVVRAPAGASTADGARLGQDPEGRVLAALLAERDEGR